MTWPRIALEALVWFPLGILTSNGFEWFFHKHVLHGMGKKKGTFWNFHWYDHHGEARRNDMYDDMYKTTWLQGGWNARTKEAVPLLAGALLWVCLLPFAPGFSLAALYSSANYYFKHRHAHIDPQWAREHMPWHFDHHMGPDQDQNWCVTQPWFDWIMRTRQHYVGTAKDTQDQEKRAARGVRASA